MNRFCLFMIISLYLKQIALAVVSIESCIFVLTCVFRLCPITVFIVLLSVAKQ